MKIDFVAEAGASGALAILVNDGRGLAGEGGSHDAATGGALTKAMGASRFTGGANSSLVVAAPSGVTADSIVLVGAGEFTGRGAARDVSGELACVVELGARNLDIEAGTLPRPPGFADHRGQANAGGLGAAFDGGRLGLRERAAAAAFARKPQRHGEPDLEFPGTIVAGEAVGLVTCLERRRLRGPGFGRTALRSKAISSVPLVLHCPWPPASMRDAGRSSASL